MPGGEGGREREGGREGERDGGREGGKEGGRKGGREEGREGGRKGGRKEGREGGREEGREGGRWEEEEEDKDGGKEGGTCSACIILAELLHVSKPYRQMQKCKAILGPASLKKGINMLIYSHIPVQPVHMQIHHQDGKH